MRLRSLSQNLLVRVVAAIVLGSALGAVMPEWLARVFMTFNGIFSQFLGFLIPLIIVGLVTPAIAELGRGAGKWLAVTAAVAYGSTVFAGLLAFLVAQSSYPWLLGGTQSIDGLENPEEHALSGYFEIAMPPVFDVMTALVLAFCLGVGITFVRGTTLHSGFAELRTIVMRVVEKVIIPLLPLYIFGMFLSLTMNGQIALVISTFLRVVVLAFIMTIVILLIQYGIAGVVARRNPLVMLKNMLPAYATALGTASSAATIPVTLACARRNGVDERVAGFTIPLCATIHLSGSTLKIVLFSTAIMTISGMPIDTWQYIGFIFLLGVTMVAAPGVPGGAIMAAVAILQSQLGFDETAVGLMIATYVAIDSFGTACNVTGDGAIAAVMDKLLRGKNGRLRNAPSATVR
ncbi:MULTISPECIES: dicarboxylate/amino acid:cation symporter [Kocuria]|uniref:Dicarboxylate/amino acid:cation symporter n=1 Tax=Kocuria rhizophila TaxID=72000 RepID=A0AAX2SET3_KOCRH|nr:MULTISPECIES: dicarboxylate/amino acid:cation symporter [Kocuria]MCG7425544.1 dicarboxylate/amino acid:cation symporter [Kocuria rhizophila]MCT1457829.1 dicarboxylate/amino acid:cation symporter [Kocuria rhizophila]MCT1956754.1 dicarboxylate/amino acid:cation symporter [Kocuria rhizophila]MCT2072697.1 dicarboxylate/amino acid:cation symporter [Kocuria rhizophila]MCT2250829.1 dicarboxylate/amino acid:cation symporter [Kocuria rhizophila]